MKKMNNKGFSMVELIIVIAIMAILAAALAPALIKYINKSRLSTDISTGTSIASAIQTALSNESAYSDCTAQTKVEFTDTNLAGTHFKEEVKSVIDPAKAVAKAKKDMNGSDLDGKFYFSVDPTSNTVEVYVGGTGAGNMVSPNVAQNLTEKTN